MRTEALSADIPDTSDDELTAAHRVMQLRCTLERYLGREHEAYDILEALVDSIRNRPRRQLEARIEAADAECEELRRKLAHTEFESWQTKYAAHLLPYVPSTCIYWLDRDHFELCVKQGLAYYPNFSDPLWPISQILYSTDMVQYLYPRLSQGQTTQDWIINGILDRMAGKTPKPILKHDPLLFRRSGKRPKSSQPII